MELDFLPIPCCACAPGPVAAAAPPGPAAGAAAVEAAEVTAVDVGIAALFAVKDLWPRASNFMFR